MAGSTTQNKSRGNFLKFDFEKTSSLLFSRTADWQTGVKMTLISNVTYAKFRAADPEKDKDAYPNLLWRLVTLPQELAMKVMCTAMLYFIKTDGLKWYKPRPFDLIDKVSGWLKFAPECSFISYFPTFLGTFYHLQDPVVIKALLKEFRGGFDNKSLFVPGRSMRGLYETIKEVFPEDGITEEDIIFTCSSGNSKYYRAWLHHLLDGKHIANYRPIICKEAKETLENWASRCSPIPIFETSMFASRIITQLMLGHKVKGEALAKAVNFINWYILHKAIGKVSKQDEIDYKEALNTFRTTVEKIIDDQDALLFVDQEKNTLSLAQKKAMAFIIFFAGQETTGIFLGCVLHSLARNKDLQQTLRTKIYENGREDEDVKKEIENLINHSLARLPPAYSIGRRVGPEQDVCLEYQLEDEETIRKLIIKSGDYPAARMMDAAKRIMESAPERIKEEHSYDIWSAFGGGAHSCLGKKLALTEVIEFVLTTLQGYELDTDLKEKPHVVGRVTLQFVEDFHLTITPARSTSARNTSDDTWFFTHFSMEPVC